MKKHIYISVVIVAFILGVIGAAVGIRFPAILLLGIVALAVLFLDYQRATYLVALFGVLDFLLRQYGGGILSSTWDELFFIFTVLLWGYKWIMDRKEKPYKLTPIDMPMIFFIAIGIFLLIVNSPNYRIAIEGLRAVVQYMLWYFAVIQLLKTKKGAKNLFIMLVLVGTILGLHGIYQYIIGVEMPAGWVDRVETGIRTRVYSVVQSPNILGSLMTLIIPMSVALIYAEKKIGKKLFFLFSTLAMTGTLVFTFSRGAWIGFMVAIAIFVLLKDKRLMIPAIIGAIIVIAFVPSVTNRIAYMLSPQYIESSLRGGRLIRWITGLQMLKSSPWLGVGLGHFGGAVAANNNIPGTFYMDNYFLKTAVEMGIVGLLAFCFLIYEVFIWSFRTLHKMKDPYYKNLVQGAIAGMSGVAVHNLFENVFEVPMMVTYFWMLVAFIMFFRERDNEKNESTIAT